MYTLMASLHLPGTWYVTYINLVFNFLKILLNRFFLQVCFSHETADIYTAVHLLLHIVPLPPAPRAVVVTLVRLFSALRSQR